MPKIRMRDVVILLPGISGSVLQKGGRDLWAISGSAGWRALTSFGRSLQEIQLSPGQGDADDGVRATRLLKGPHMVPGLSKIDGYASIANLITERFEVITGDLESNHPANFFEFPYDWRRDNRIAAHALDRLIRRQLPAWRKHSGAADARVILLAHSMGGLVSRYYLEVLEGWRDCRALITFGTPYRGAPHALNFLANGYKQILVDLTEALRSFPSVYQLLPIYEMVQVNGRYQRVANTDGIPNVVRTRAKDALAFHREIETAVDSHLDVPEYRAHYRTIPFVGTTQNTLQSAELTGGRLVARYNTPAVVDPLLGDGDGTVPRVSAIPIELSQDYRETFIAERHSTLQVNGAVLADVLERMKQMQADIGLGAVRGSDAMPSLENRPAIALTLDDLYVQGEPVEVRAKIVNGLEDPQGIEARVQLVQPDGKTDGAVRVAQFGAARDQWSLELGAVAAGSYRIEVRTRKAGPSAPPPIHDLFGVALAE